ncbi:RAD51-associated protein 1 [Hyalella azteca]|uniref:RAD51-associated protein 1 n=1 Tax=Hyalella azteca TaxID=294128 RepID=A0A8B7PPC1_HYAAZ|nr:RAD51-associated protein 1 [Hyalella azteca]
MTSFLGKRIRKVVNYAALDQDTDISDEDEFSGFVVRGCYNLDKESPASLKNDNKTSVCFTNKLKKMSRNIDSASDYEVASSDGDALESSSGSTAGRLSVRDRLFERDLAAAVEMSSKPALISDYNADKSQAYSAPHGDDETKASHVGASSPYKIRETSKQKSGVNESNEQPSAQSLDPIVGESVKGDAATNKEQSEVSATPENNITRKSVPKKPTVGISVSSDDHFSPAATKKSNKKSSATARSSHKRGVEALNGEVQASAPTRSKRACRRETFKPDIDSESEDSWAESSEDDANCSDPSDFEESPKSKKRNSVARIQNPKELVKSSENTVNNNTNSNIVAKSTKNPDHVQATSSSPRTQHFPISKNQDVSSTVNCDSRTKPSKIASFKASRVSVPTKLCDANEKSSVREDVIESCPASRNNSSVVAASSRNLPFRSSSSPKLGLARAPFRSPAIASKNTPTNNLSVNSTPGLGLRLGLSRRTSLKSLHPNATIK